ncbi:MAG: hypothetical protein ABSG45_00010 [Nitrososphaerales archaeon]|jgi:hypothetical protein
MKSWAKISVGLAAALVVLALFLLPVVSISVEAATGTPNSSVDHITSASASMMYAYFGVGAVQISNSYGGGHSYCLMYGDPGTMCGFAMHRMNQMTTP